MAALTRSKGTGHSERAGLSLLQEQQLSILSSGDDILFKSQPRPTNLESVTRDHGQDRQANNYKEDYQLVQINSVHLHSPSHP